MNTYVFDPQEEEIGCCSCLVTPNGLNSLSAKSDLISNNLTPAVPTSIIIKLVASPPAPQPRRSIDRLQPGHGRLHGRRFRSRSSGCSLGVPPWSRLPHPLPITPSM